MKKILYISAIALIGVVCYSCQDFLVAENKSAGSNADDYFATDEGQKAFLATAYSKLKPLVTNTAINEWGTDIYTSVDDSPGNIHQYTLSAEEGTVKDYYTDAYSLINDANGVIMYSGGQGAYTDEAKFLRNYGYYLLTQQFGDVPYITEYIDNANRSYPREKRENIYSGMITELEELFNSENLPERSEGVNLGHASKRAVAALLSKVYLAAGWDIQTSLTDAAKGTYTVNSTEYFAKAAEWADKTIGGQELSLSFADKWSPSKENNAEEIFSVQYDRENYPGNVIDGGHRLQNAFGHGYGSSYQNGFKSGSSELIPSPKALYLWDEGDTRWDGTFMHIMCNAGKKDNNAVWEEGYYAYYNNPNWEELHIGLAYFPYYYEQADVESWINENKSRFVNKDYANTIARVLIMGNPMTRFRINMEGEIESTVSFSYEEGTKEQSGNGVTVKKYDDPKTEANGGTGYRDIVLFHLSDMYLVAAEAYLMAGDEPTALNRVNAVRTRAQATRLNSFDDYVEMYELPVSFNDLTALDVILDEKARELFGENEGRWVDLRRTKQMVRYNLAFNRFTPSVKDMSNPQGDIKWLRPIPAAEISSNEGISPEDQNPGY